MIRSIADAAGLISHDDWELLADSLGSYSRFFKPDVTLAPAGPDKPYLFRWYLVDRKERGSVMLHLQVASDPERPLHDHPWQNQSIILSGGYEEISQLNLGDRNSPADGEVLRSTRTVGDVIVRPQRLAHRLIMPEGVPYTLTIFTAGPKLDDWGFWYPDGWHHNERHINERASRGQISVHVEDKGV